MTGVSSRYRVLRRLGQGGMAEVFEAELVGDLGFVRKVALKQLRPDAMRDPMAAQRFIDETRIASQLHHAHIVGVLDVGVLDDRPFQVLELVDGLDADELIRRAGGALPPELALMLAHAVAHALDHAHTATNADGRPLGIVHRDVKPPNILVSWTGDVKLADFGIAVAHERMAHTETGMVAGTRGFIAPEQRLRGQIDGRSDVFALGATLHALCTGRSPMSDVEAEIKLINGEPIDLDLALPADIRGLVARAIAPERLARPTAAELAGAIGDALAARGAHDARSALQIFLSPMRRPTRTAGALDGLLGVEIIAVDSPGTVQLYEAAARVAPALRDGQTPFTAMAPAGLLEMVEPKATKRLATPEAISELPVEPAPRNRTRAIALASLGLAVVAGAAILLLNPGEHATPKVAAVTMRPFDAAAQPSVIATAVTPIDAAPADAVGIDASTHLAGAPSVPVVHPSIARPHPIPVAHPPPEAPSDPAARGYIQVVGEDLLRARVLVDGVAVGYVPNRFAVPLGHHRVEVERPDGTKLPPRELDVTSFHTAQRPARPSW